MLIYTSKALERGQKVTKKLIVIILALSGLLQAADVATCKFGAAPVNPMREFVEGETLTTVPKDTVVKMTTKKEEVTCRLGERQVVVVGGKGKPWFLVCGNEIISGWEAPKLHPPPPAPPAPPPAAATPSPAPTTKIEIKDYSSSSSSSGASTWQPVRCDDLSAEPVPDGLEEQCLSTSSGDFRYIRPYGDTGGWVARGSTVAIGIEFHFSGARRSVVVEPQPQPRREPRREAYRPPPQPQQPRPTRPQPTRGVGPGGVTGPVLRGGTAPGGFTTGGGNGGSGRTGRAFVRRR